MKAMHSVRVPKIYDHLEADPGANIWASTECCTVDVYLAMYGR